MSENILKTKAKNPTDAVFGVDTEGNCFHMPLSKMVHILVAGMTGSGKSVFMNSLLISMMSHATPDELRISWIDPKKVEATAYVGLPYCPIDPVTDMRDAYGLIAFAVWEMERRYKLIQDTNQKQLSEFNDWVEKNPTDPIAKSEGKMPYWVFVIDEFADLKSTAPEVEDLIKRLAAKGRAAGIILILATQRPSVDVISGTLKSNFPSKIALRVNSSTNSMIILDHEGAEKLKGYGDAIVLDAAGKETRVQGTYISNKEIDSIFSYLRKKYAPDMGRLKRYVKESLKSELTDASKDVLGMNGGVLDFKLVTTDENLCKAVEMKQPFCDWASEEDPQTYPKNPEKWHVSPHRESRGRLGHFA